MDSKLQKAISDWLSLFLKLVGVAGIVFVPVFWAFTDRFEPAFLPFFVVLAGVGQGIDAVKEITQNKGRPPDDL